MSTIYTTHKRLKESINLRGSCFAADNAFAIEGRTKRAFHVSVSNEVDCNMQLFILKYIGLFLKCEKAFCCFVLQ